jgi:histidinol-phosphate aminotransferase
MRLATEPPMHGVDNPLALSQAQLRQRIGMITTERARLRMRLRAMGIRSTDSHANFVFLPPNGRPWSEAFEGTGLQVRSYGDGGARITVGNRTSTQVVLKALGSSVAEGVI